MRRVPSLQLRLALSCALLLAPSARGQSTGPPPPLQIVPPPPLYDGIVTQSYFASFGTNYPVNDTYSWSVVSGILPPGLNLSGTSAPSLFITGTPTSVGKFAFRLQVTDSTA